MRNFKHLILAFIMFSVGACKNLSSPLEVTNVDDFCISESGDSTFLLANGTLASYKNQSIKPISKVIKPSLLKCFGEKLLIFQNSQPFQLSNGHIIPVGDSDKEKPYRRLFYAKHNFNGMIQSYTEVFSSTVFYPRAILGIREIYPLDNEMLILGNIRLDANLFCNDFDYLKGYFQAMTKCAESIPPPSAIIHRKDKESQHLIVFSSKGKHWVFELFPEQSLQVGELSTPIDSKNLPRYLTNSKNRDFQTIINPKNSFSFNTYIQKENERECIKYTQKSDKTGTIFCVKNAIKKYTIYPTPDNLFSICILTNAKILSCKLHDIEKMNML